MADSKTIITHVREKNETNEYDDAVYFGAKGDKILVKDNVSGTGQYYTVQQFFDIFMQYMKEGKFMVTTDGMNPTIDNIKNENVIFVIDGSEKSA
jgi:hypothetical protein